MNTSWWPGSAASGSTFGRCHGGVEARGEPLLPDGAWARRRVEVPFDPAPAFVAVVDNNGQGAAVAVVVPHVELGVLEVGGCPVRRLGRRWAFAARVTDAHRRSLVLPGDGMTLDQRRFPPCTRFTEPARAATRTGLALLRSHVATGRVVHDVTATWTPRSPKPGWSPATSG